MTDEPCVCATAFTCMADEHDALVDWPARFRAAAEAADHTALITVLNQAAKMLRHVPPDEREAIGRALLGEETP